MERNDRLIEAPLSICSACSTRASFLIRLTLKKGKKKISTQASCAKCDITLVINNTPQNNKKLKLNNKKKIYFSSFFFF